jgi:hypothetical protein
VCVRGEAVLNTLHQCVCEERLFSILSTSVCARRLSLTNNLNKAVAGYDVENACECRRYIYIYIYILSDACMHYQIHVAYVHVCGVRTSQF